MLRQERDRIAKFLLQWGQVGVGVPGGWELAHRAVDMALEAFHDLGASLWDCSNAF
jgi:UDP-N-acetylglucosamine enolpyruvyl transferase